MRRLLIALLFSLTAWATLAQITPRTVATPTAAADACAETEAGAPRDAGHSDSRWIAAHRAIVSVTESRWKSSGGHATHAAVPARSAFVDTLRGHASDRSAPTRSAHLLHTPLLI